MPSEKKKGLGKKGVVAAVVLCAVVGALLIYFVAGNKEKPSMHVTGIMDGVEVNLSSKAAGRIVSVCCNEGDTVKNGQTAITLESDDIKASVAQAGAAVERANSDIKVSVASVENAKANILIADSDMKSAAADLDKARVQMEEAVREADRAEELYKKEYISRESRDQIVSSSKGSAAAYESTKEKLNSARSRKTAALRQLDAATSQLSSSRAMLKEAEANLAFNRSKLADMTIASPVAGTVIFKAVEAGETVAPGVTILTIVDLNSLYARVDVDETRIGGVVLNSPALVTVEGVPGKGFKGKVSEIGRYAEFATQRDVIRGREDIKTFRVKVRVDNTEGILKPGMTVDVEISKK